MFDNHTIAGKSNHVSLNHLRYLSIYLSTSNYHLQRSYMKKLNSANTGVVAEVIRVSYQPIIGNTKQIFAENLLNLLHCKSE